MLNLKLAKKGKKGQGVVEYAGALVVAAALIAAALAFAPDAISGMFSDIVDNITQQLQDGLP